MICFVALMISCDLHTAFQNVPVTFKLDFTFVKTFQFSLWYMCFFLTVFGSYRQTLLFPTVILYLDDNMFLQITLLKPIYTSTLVAINVSPKVLYV